MSNKTPEQFVKDLSLELVKSASKTSFTLTRDELLAAMGGMWEVMKNIGMDKGEVRGVFPAPGVSYEDAMAEAKRVQAGVEDGTIEVTEMFGIDGPHAVRELIHCGEIAPTVVAQVPTATILKVGEYIESLEERLRKKTN